MKTRRDIARAVGALDRHAADAREAERQRERRRGEDARRRVRERLALLAATLHMKVVVRLA